MSDNRTTIKAQIIEALRHPEAEEGLYFDNFSQLHEEDERAPVIGEDLEILDALRELIEEGKVTTDESAKEVIFFLKNAGEERDLS